MDSIEIAYVALRNAPKSRPTTDQPKQDSSRTTSGVL